MAAGVRIPRARRTRRRVALAAAAGVMAVAAAALTIPGAFADDGSSGPGAVVEELPVDDSLLGLVKVGKTEDVDESLTDADGGRIELHRPDASYVKVHFERMLLDAGDYVTVSSPDGSESYRYEQSMTDDWATSITGDTAIVELHRDADAAVSDALGLVLDKAAYGYPAEVVDRLVDEKTQQARQPESVCDTDDKRPTPCYASSYPDVVGHAKPVARLLIDGTVLCTAFRVGENDRMLTNHHCLSKSWEARRTEVWFGYDCKSCEGDGETAPVKVPGSRVLATSRDLDYTLFTVRDFDSIERFGWLDLSTEPARRGEAIYIPQHPGGRPTEIAMESSIDGGNCVVKDPTYDGYVVASDVSYYCDTEFGSSGSPVLSRDTHEVVALHHFGGCPNSGVSAYLIERQIHLLL